MKKLFSLIKACMSSDMNLFVINNKRKDGKKPSKALPIAIYLLLLISFFGYSNIFLDSLIELNLGYVLLTLFVAITFILTLIEGIYKTSSLLFNCKDDDLLLSLPIKKSTVLFVRIFKFYLFELLYNTVFMLPAMIAYALRIDVGISYYVVSFIMLLLLPVIPVAISCIIGALISGGASRFKYKNLVQIIITSLFFVFIIYLSFNLTEIIKSISSNASSLNEIITRIYYPAGAYATMVVDFKITDLLIFIGINIGIFAFVVFLLSKVYFKINTRVKSVSSSKNKDYKIRTNGQMSALMKKEGKKFITSPVFITNASLGLVLFIIACISISVKFDFFAKMLSSQGFNITEAQVEKYIPLVLFSLISFAALMTSITSSMISLEGRSINILRSLPISSGKIIISKVLASTLIMVPCILVGDIIIFIFFNFTIIQMLLILLASIALPLASSLVGIVMNLKYPKMDALNDSEVVKQSMSSTISVFIGMGLLAANIFALIKLLKVVGIDLSLIIVLSFYVVLDLVLLLFLKKKGIKEFDSITV